MITPTKTPVIFIGVGASGGDPTIRNFGYGVQNGWFNSAFDQQLDGWVEHLARSGWPTRIIVHNPWGTSGGGEDMDFDQRIECLADPNTVQAALTFPDYLEQRLRPLVDDGGEVIIYVGSIKDDPDMVALEDDLPAYYARAEESLLDIPDWCSIAFDDVNRLTEDHPGYAVINGRVGVNPHVYIEPRPGKEGDMAKFGVCAIARSMDDGYFRHDPIRYPDSSDWAHPRSEIEGEVIVIVQNDDGLIRRELYEAILDEESTPCIQPEDAAWVRNLYVEYGLITQPSVANATLWDQGLLSPDLLARWKFDDNEAAKEITDRQDNYTLELHIGNTEDYFTAATDEPFASWLDGSINIRHRDYDNSVISNKASSNEFRSLGLRQLSAMGWCRLDDLSRTGELLLSGKGDWYVNWRFQSVADNKLQVVLYAGWTIFKQFETVDAWTTSTGDWHHIGFTWSEETDTLLIYVDGEAVAVEEIVNDTGTLDIRDVTLTFNARPDRQNVLSASYADWRLYQTAVPASWITAMIAGPRRAPATPDYLPRFSDRPKTVSFTDSLNVVGFDD